MIIANETTMLPPLDVTATALDADDDYSVLDCGHDAFTDCDCPLPSIYERAAESMDAREAAWGKQMLAEVDAR